jgi:hypothetical protein
MDIVRSYTRLALDCLRMAEKAHDPATRDDMRRLAQLWARLADHAKNWQTPDIDHGRAA